jgi:hypothetical protein
VWRPLLVFHLVNLNQTQPLFLLFVVVLSVRILYKQFGLSGTGSFYAKKKNQLKMFVAKNAPALPVRFYRTSYYCAARFEDEEKGAIEFTS